MIWREFSIEMNGGGAQFALDPGSWREPSVRTTRIAPEDLDCLRRRNGWQFLGTLRPASCNGARAR